MILVILVQKISENFPKRTMETEITPETQSEGIEISKDYSSLSGSTSAATSPPRKPAIMNLRPDHPSPSPHAPTFQLSKSILPILGKSPLQCVPASQRLQDCKAPQPPEVEVNPNRLLRNERLTRALTLSCGKIFRHKHEPRPRRRCAIHGFQG